MVRGWVGIDNEGCSPGVAMLHDVARKSAGDELGTVSDVEGDYKGVGSHRAESAGLRVPGWW